MTKLIALFSVFIAIFSSCSYLPYSKQEVIRMSKSGKKKNVENIVVEDNGNTLKVLVRDSNYQHLDEIYRFNDKGDQLQYTLVASCDSCFKEYLVKIMSNKKYKWTSINDSTFISKPSAYSSLIVHNSTYSYEIIRRRRND